MFILWARNEKAAFSTLVQKSCWGGWPEGPVNLICLIVELALAVEFKNDVDMDMDVDMDVDNGHTGMGVCTRCAPATESTPAREHFRLAYLLTDVHTDWRTY